MPDAESFLPPNGSALRNAFEKLLATFHRHGVEYAIIGGIAMIQHGRVRATDDIDALLHTNQIRLPSIFEDLHDRGFVFDQNRAMREIREDGVTTLCYEGVNIDLLRPIIPAFRQVLDKAITTKVFGQDVRLGSAEGLIILKLAASRPQDDADIRDLLIAYSGNLDIEFIRSAAESFMPLDDPRWLRFVEWVREAIQLKPS